MKALLILLLSVTLAGCRARMSGTDGVPYRPSPDELRHVCPF